MAPNLWDTAKAVPRGKFIPIQCHLKKQKNSQINDLILHLKQQEKEEQRKPKISRRKEVIKIRPEINEIEMKKTIAKINKTKSWFFKKINKIDKPLARIIKKKGRELKSIKLEMRDFPGGTVVKNHACQCRGHRYKPWSRNIPHAAEQLSPCATTTEPALQSS